MKTSVTISLLPSSPKRPFVLGPDLPQAVRVAAELGFDAFELFPPSLDAIDEEILDQSIDEFEIPVSTIGTGGGAVSQGLTLTDDNPEIRDQAMDYVRRIIEIAGDRGAAAIIGSMQGRAGDRDSVDVLNQLGELLSELGEYALKWDQPLFYEPLNRYETDLINQLDEAADWLNRFDANNVQLLADLFHMNIEEVCVPTAILENGEKIGHVHFVDTNRQAMSRGHLDPLPIVEALQKIDFSGYLAVEAFPIPDTLSAASEAMDEFRRLGLA